MTREQLMARTRCARCNEVGHWAKECTAPTASKGAKGSSRDGAYKNHEQCHVEHQGPQWTPVSNSFSVFGSPEKGRVRPGFVLSCYVPRTLPTLYPGEFVLDTGSEVSQIGTRQWEALFAHIRDLNMSSRSVPLQYTHTRPG